MGHYVKANSKLGRQLAAAKGTGGYASKYTEMLSSEDLKRIGFERLKVAEHNAFVEAKRQDELAARAARRAAKEKK